MNKTVMILAIVCMMFASSYAVDPGIPDTVIFQQKVYVPNNPGQWSTAAIEVYFVTDDSVGDFNLPITWRSSDGQVYPDTVIWHNVFTEWDDAWYSIVQDSLVIHMFGWSDLGGGGNPLLFTNMQRMLGCEIRFKISPTASPQIVAIDTTRDGRMGSVNFDPPDGGTGFKPQIVSGSIYYGISTVIDNKGILPEGFGLAQNYPNPFNPSTQIDFTLPADDQVTIAVFNLLGQKIKTLISEYRSAGKYYITWNGTDDSGQSVPSGAYFYRMTTGSFVDTKKMMFLK
jgi:hypothetical protein